MLRACPAPPPQLRHWVAVAAELGLQRLHQLASTALATNLVNTLNHARAPAKASYCSYGGSSVCPPGAGGCRSEGEGEGGG
jgi:hypothetical protein